MTEAGMRLAFAGTPALSATILETILLDNIHTIESIFTQPDRRAGRGRKPQVSAVKQLAQRYGIPVEQPSKPAELDPGKQLKKVDVMVVAAYGMLLPGGILERPRLGCINVHTSLLPRWRGAAPIQRAIQAGDNVTGITIMQMDAGLDTGDILLQKVCAISARDTAGSLHDRLALLGGEALLEALHGLKTQTLSPRQQDHSLACYAKKFSKEEAQINWKQAAKIVERSIRAFNPSPIAWTTLNHVDMRIRGADIIPDSTKGIAPGSVIACSQEGIIVTCADSPIRITELQLPGKKVITARDFYNSHPDFLSKCYK